MGLGSVLGTERSSAQAVISCSRKEGHTASLPLTIRLGTVGFWEKCVCV